MRRLHRVSVALGVFLVLPLPLDQARCASMALRPTPVVAHVEEQATDDDDCCNDSASPSTPSDPCCGACQQLPAAALPTSVVLATPQGESVLLAGLPSSVVPLEVSDAFVGHAPDTPTSSPPDPATSSQSPRSPPYFA